MNIAWSGSIALHGIAEAVCNTKGICGSIKNTLHSFRIVRSLISSCVQTRIKYLNLSENKFAYWMRRGEEYGKCRTVRYVPKSSTSSVLRFFSASCIHRWGRISILLHFPVTHSVFVAAHDTRACCRHDSPYARLHSLRRDQRLGEEENTCIFYVTLHSARRDLPARVRLCYKGIWHDKRDAEGTTITSNFRHRSSRLPPLPASS